MFKDNDNSNYDIDEDRPIVLSRSQSAAKSTERHYSGTDYKRSQQHSSSFNSFQSPFDTSQQSFPSDLLAPTDSPFLNEATKPLPKELTANAVEIAKIANVVAAIAGCLYFYLMGYYDVVLEYDQVLFLSILVNILDSKPGILRTIWFIGIIMSGISWTLMAVYQATWTLPIYHRVAWTLMAFVYDAGTISCAYVILHHPSKKLKTTNFLELDLLLYLVTLNAICIFPIEHFNSSLHMILDIRMIVLLYSGLYRPHDKIALLRRKSLWFIMLCIISFFVLVSNNDPWFQFAGSIVNIGLGVTLIGQAWLFHFVKYPQMRKLQELEDQVLARDNHGVLCEDDTSEARGSSVAMSRLSNPCATVQHQTQTNPILSNAN